MSPSVIKGAAIGLVPAAPIAVAAATAILARSGLVHRERPALVLRFIQSADRRLCLGLAGHLREAKAFTAAGVTVRDRLRSFDRTEL